MKKIILLAAVTLFAIGCSDDDSGKKCNCNEVVSEYNENLQAYEVISSDHYSNDCSDEQGMAENPDGTFTSIECTQN